jgi:ABC-type amino acid transport substrate-binding protein
MVKRFCILLCALLGALLSPGCGNNGKPISIGIDPNWYPLDFHGQTSSVNGFIEELLLEISRDSGLEIHRIGANWDSLNEGLRRKRYDAILSSMQPYNFNVAKYDFSKNILDTGPVLVVHASSKAKGLKDMGDKIVGVLPSNQTLLTLQKEVNVLMRTYDTASEALDALVNNELEGVILDRLTAVGFLSGLYTGKLKISGPPLNDAGLHLMTLKGQDHTIELFNKSLQHLTKKKKVQKLKKKWQLDI